MKHPLEEQKHGMLKVQVGRCWPLSPVMLVVWQATQPLAAGANNVCDFIGNTYVGKNGGYLV